MGKINTDRLVAAHVAGLTLAETAAVCGCSVSTVQRHLNEPEVEQAIAEQRSQQSSEEAALWSQLRSEAVQVLRDSLGSEIERNRMWAADKLLAQADRFDVVSEFAKKQAAINEALLVWMADHSESGS